MELFFNECSLHGQFPDIPTFVSSLDVLMQMRQTAKRYGRELHCHRNWPLATVTHQLTLPQVIQRIDKNKARVLMNWFSQTGPYWEDGRRHKEDDLLECQATVVTDTAIGECAYLRFENKPAQLASITPSDWTTPQLKVVWRKNDVATSSETIFNHLSPDTLEPELKKATPPLESWEQLSHVCRQRFDNLHFTDDTFKHLKGKPFVSSAAKAIVNLLDILSQFKDAHLSGGRSEEGHRLYQEFFTDGSLFSDSSKSEKNDFRSEMTFPHPGIPSERLFATYHGKVQTPQMRIHFSWPVKADTPLYVVYVGDKITKH